MYLIEILHQTTTTSYLSFHRSQLYLIEILHQTTTFCRAVLSLMRCILSKFYIKPQHISGRLRLSDVVSYRNSTSNHNSTEVGWRTGKVVSYRNSTSNHNVTPFARLPFRVVSYRNSTSNHNSCLCISGETALYLIEILHQTTTSGLILIDKVLLTGCLPL